MTAVGKSPPAEMTRKTAAPSSSLPPAAAHASRPTRSGSTAPKSGERDGADRDVSQQEIVVERKLERKIGILVIAGHWQADYVPQAHIRMARDVGVVDSAIDAICAGKDPELDRAA